MADEQQPAFAAQRIYLKDVSYEAPNAPGIFLQEWEPEVNVEMDNSVTELDENGVYDVQLKITVTAKTGDHVAYIAEVVQGGIFLVTGFEEKDRLRLTGAVCPDTLYPYAREALSNLMTKGSFPPFLLTPVNFDYIYNKRLEDSEKTEAEPAASE
ncbi:MAG: protein-export chaperone SecB [Gammaproteobacteria bacterium]|nr:MAG: protein-export chaperone SecB [Gammaproteobacteria bacterium]